MTKIELPEGVESQRIKIRGVEIHFLFKEDTALQSEHRPSVVFIHGNTGSCRWWDLNMDLQGYNTFALDMPNFGLSEAIDESDIHGYADYVQGFIDALELKNPLIIGHSLGGAVSLSLASRYKDGISGLVLVDSSSPKGLVTPEEHYPVIEMFKTNHEMFSSALAAVTPTLQDSDRRELLLELAKKMNPDSFSGNARALARFDVSQSLKDFGKPVLILWGDLDSIITREMIAETVSAFGEPLPQVREFPGVGHSPMVEAPELFNKVLVEFLEEHFSE